MASISSLTNSVEVPGPLVDDAAPYNGHGVVELHAFHRHLIPDWDGTIDNISNSFKDRPFWQYM